MKTIRHYYSRVRRLFEYLPIIWKVYDFDYRHAINIFRYQLERTANFLESDRSYSVEAKQEARRIKNRNRGY